MKSDMQTYERRNEHWHLTKAIPISLIVAFVVQTFLFGWYVATLDGRVERNTKLMIAHHSNKAEHMPFAEKIRVFVPRIEIEKDLAAIKKSQDEIKDDLKTILRATK